VAIADDVAAFRQPVSGKKGGNGQFFCLSLDISSRICYYAGIVNERRKHTTHMREEISQQIIMLAHAHRHYAEEALSQIGLHATQEHILFLLHQEDGLTPTQLASRWFFNVGLATIVKTIGRMERAGFLESRPDPRDRRASRVYLTERGCSLYKPALQVWNALTERTVRGMNDIEQVLFRRLLQQAVENLVSDEDE
jgi:DNA-binding MarR family transcriptional regulator